jgi:hypothetical protein
MGNCLVFCNVSNFSFDSVGFSSGDAGSQYASTNSYAIKHNFPTYDYWLSGKQHKFEHPVDPIKSGAVVGCGLLLNSKNQLAVFFTRNGLLLGKLLLTHIINDFMNN